MSAPLNNYLFGEHFKRIHGMSVDDALSGKVAKINDTLMSAEEYDDAWKGSRIGAGMRPFAESHADFIKPTDVSHTVAQFQMERGEHLIGNPHRVAASLRDLTDAVRGNSRENDVTLYRGARRLPSLDVGESKDTALSFTPDLNVARSFAAPRGNSRGSIFKAAPGLVRGVPLSEIGGIRRTVGDKRRPEAEWLVDPTSVPTEWPKK
jgi:hypothetical protein